MWMIADLLPEKAVRLLRAVGGVAIGIGAFCLLLGGTIALTLEDDLMALVGIVVGLVGLLFIVLGGALRAMGTGDAFMNRQM